MNGQNRHAPMSANVFFLYSISNVRAGSAFDLDNAIQTLVQRLGHDDPETVNDRHLSQSHSSLG